MSTPDTNEGLEVGEELAVGDGDAMAGEGVAVSVTVTVAVGGFAASWVAAVP